MARRNGLGVANPRADRAPWTVAWLQWLTTTEELSAQARWVVDDLLDELACMTKRIKANERRLDAVTAGDPVVSRLLTEPGVGKITPWTLRAEIGRFDRFRSGKQLSRFCGLSPRNASSGQRQSDAGLVKAGNPELRAVLVETAHRLARYEPRWQQFKLRLRSRGKRAGAKWPPRSLTDGREGCITE